MHKERKTDPMDAARCQHLRIIAGQALILLVATSCFIGWNHAYAGRRGGRGLAPPERLSDSQTPINGDPVLQVHKAIFDTLKKSRGTQDYLYNISVRVLTRVRAAEAALAQCMRDPLQNCIMQRAELEVVTRNANEAISEAAIVYRQALMPLVRLCRDEIVRNVISDRWAFRRLQRDSLEAKSNRFLTMTAAVHLLQNMVSGSEDMIRDAVRMEVKTQWQNLTRLRDYHKELERTVERIAPSTAHNLEGRR